MTTTHDHTLSYKYSYFQDFFFFFLVVVLRIKSMALQVLYH
jgi:hypothetical protein